MLGDLCTLPPVLGINVYEFLFRKYGMLLDNLKISAHNNELLVHSLVLISLLSELFL